MEQPAPPAPLTAPALPDSVERGLHSEADRRGSSDGSERRQDGEPRNAHRGEEHSSRRRHHRSRSERSSSRRSSDPQAHATLMRGSRADAGDTGTGTEPAALPRPGLGATLLENRSRSRRHRNGVGSSARKRIRTGWGAMAARSLAIGTGFSALAVAAWLASAHPLSSLVAVVAAVALAVFGALWPAWAPIAVLPLLPLAGLMPWTGWLVVEEFDIVMLALAGGAYLRLALGRPDGDAPRLSLKRAAWLGLPFVASVVVSMFGGLIDSGAIAAAQVDVDAVGAVGAAASGATAAVAMASAHGCSAARRPVGPFGSARQSGWT